MKVGILGYGVYIPRERIESQSILKEREKKNPKLDDLVSRLTKGLLVKNKAIASIFEDSATLAYEAASNAIRMSGIDPVDIEAVIVGTESKPYAVKPIATQVGSWIGASNYKYAFDLECACLGGIQAISVTKAYVSSKSIKCGMGIGTDVSSAAEKDDLEYAVGAGGVAGVVGRGTEDELIGELYSAVPYTSDYPDFFRRDGVEYPKHFGPTTADAYIEHVDGAIIKLLEKTPDMCLADFDDIAPHEPNGWMPKKAFSAFVPEEIEKIKNKPEKERSLTDNALLRIDETLEIKGLKERSRLTREDIEKKLVPNLKPVLEIGNTYAAQTGIVLSYILDKAKPYQKILVASYGSGGGSIATPFLVLPGIEKKRGIVPTVDDYIDRMVEIKLNTYKKLFKERMKRWAAEHLTFRKIVGAVEPAEDNDGFYNASICKKCGAMYTPGRWCLDSNHAQDELVYLDLPKKSVLKSFSAHSLRKSFRETASNIMLQGKVILVDCKKEDLYSGMKLEPVIRRLDQEGKDGLIYYGWAYRPLFRDSEKYLSHPRERKEKFIEATHSKSDKR